MRAVKLISPRTTLSLEGSNPLAAALLIAGSQVTEEVCPVRLTAGHSLLTGASYRERNVQLSTILPIRTWHLLDLNCARVLLALPEIINLCIVSTGSTSGDVNFI